MSWNNVLNLFLEIKEKARRKGIDLWNYNKNNKSCLKYWIQEIGEYQFLLKTLHMMEYNDFLLLKYKRYKDILKTEEEKNIKSIEDFWKLYDGLFLECRSVVIDIKNDTLVLTPFKKFFNLNEIEETSYENIKQRIKTAKLIEISDKLDGSMQSARWYNNQLVMSGSESLDKNKSWRLADGYRMFMENNEYLKMAKDNPDITFIFEYISKKDVHIVHYETEGLFLIGCRNVKTGKEYDYHFVLEMANKYHIPTTVLFNKTFKEILSQLDDKKSNEAEGFVINIDGYRIKLKYNDYVLIHRVLSAISSVNLIIQAIADDRLDDLYAKTPIQYRYRIINIANIVFDYQKKKEEEIDRLFSQMPVGDKKSSMIWIEHNIPRDMRGYLRLKYLNQSYNVLKRGNRYIKLKDMGIPCNQYSIFVEGDF